MVNESKPSEDWDAAGTAHVTPSERQKGLVARHVVRSETRGNENLGPNRKSRSNAELTKLYAMAAIGTAIAEMAARRRDLAGQRASESNIRRPD